jgi:hypothetical protein
MAPSSKSGVSFICIALKAVFSPFSGRLEAIVVALFRHQRHCNGVPVGRVSHIGGSHD